jgi:hypothetical protein
MDPTSLLEQLRGVHSPDSIGTWPPAIGWILLAVLVVASLIAIILFTVKWYRSNAWRRVALKEYKFLQLDYQKAPSPRALSEISSLLKRCAASINQDPTILSLSGTAWKNLLEVPKSPLTEYEIKILCFGHYQAECDLLDDTALLRIKKWIKTLNYLEAESSSSEKDSATPLPIQNAKLENKTS